MVMCVCERERDIKGVSLYLLLTSAVNLKVFLKTLFNKKGGEFILN